MSKCKTSGATYTTVIHNGGCAVTMMVTLPHTLDLDDKNMRRLKSRLHTAVEGALADTFNFGLVRGSSTLQRHTYMVVKEDPK